MSSGYKYIFGPVASRRLGRSLGIDLISYKTCSFDCIYCQVGKTTNQTIERAEYVPTQAVLTELEQRLKNPPGIDFLTFSGSGEPTLHIALGQIIKRLKQLSPLPIAVLTNGSLLWRGDVQKDLIPADIVLPTLSSPTPENFQRIHHPHPDLKLEKIIEGMINFRKIFKGKIWLEVFLVKGINDNEKEMQSLKSIIEKIQPDKIQLNTSVRVPSEEHPISVDEEKMSALAKILGERAELIAEFRAKEIALKSLPSEEEILNYLRRRPATIQDLSSGLSLSEKQAEAVLQELIQKGKIQSQTWEGKQVFYIVGKK